MAANVVDLDSRRRKEYVPMRCLFCHTDHAAVIRITRRTVYYPCPNCDEEASLPARDVPLRTLDL